MAQQKLIKNAFIIYETVKDYPLHHQPRHQIARQIPAGHLQRGAPHPRGGGAAGTAHQGRRPGSPRPPHQGQPAICGLCRKTIPEPGPQPPRPHQRGQRGTHQSSQTLRRDTRLQVHLLRRVVDTPVDSAGHRRELAHRASALQPARSTQQTKKRNLFSGNKSSETKRK